MTKCVYLVASDQCIKIETNSVYILKYESSHLTYLSVKHTTNDLSTKLQLKYLWFKHILFDQSLLHRYNIIEVGSDSKP